MEGCSNVIRVRVDLSEIELPFVKQAWVAIDRTVLRTVKDFKHSLYRKFKLPENRNISLYLQRCLLLDDETVFILRDEDFIRVVYEDLPSLFGTTCPSFADFTSSSARSHKRHLSDDNFDTSSPVAKKLRSLSPGFNISSLCGISETQISQSGSRCLGESRSIPTEMNADVYVDKTGLGGVKHKKCKRRKKMKNINSHENLLLLEERVRGSASETHEINVCQNDDSLFPGVDAHVQEDGNNSVQNATNLKKHKRENKHSTENIVQPVKRINDTFGDTDDAGKSKPGSSLLCQKGNEDDEDKIISAYCPVNEEELFGESIAHGVCGVLENNVNVQKQGSNLNSVSNLRDLDPSQNDKGDQVSPQFESTVSDFDHENVLSPSLKNSPVQVVLSNDCTQSLGSNCPKKKRRRRRRRGPPNVAGPSSSTISNNFGDALPLFQHSIEKPASDVINVVRNEHNRKHIRFTDSPESSLVVKTLDSKYSGNSTEKEISASLVVKTLDSKCSGNSTENEISANIDNGDSGQESFKTKVSPACQMYALVEKYLQNASDNEERRLPAQGDGTNNRIYVIATGSKPLVDGPKCYSGFPSLNKFPSVGDVIAYKMLELSDSYCPEVSDYKEGMIVNIDTSTDMLEVELLEKQVIVRTGKFENLYPDETPEPQVIKKVSVHWSALIEPKLISSSGTL